MSGICGIVNWDGQPVDPELLKKMAEAAAYRGPDGIRYWIEGNVGFAHLALNTTPESLRERQPLVNRRGDLVLTADARVDNRDELIRTLTSKGYIEDKDPTDADLILASYDCWGEDCPKYIIGDFAFAVWDKRERKLFCARDPIGMKLLHYSQINKSFYISTAIRSIVAICNSYPEKNDALLRDTIANEFGRWVYETAYLGIFRLPQSYYLVNKMNNFSLKRYWTWGNQTVISFRKEDDYVVYFHDLLEQAVKARMRTCDPIGILMSGGLDSTSVACLVDQIIEREGIGKARLYSAIFNSIPTADEREYIEAVGKKCKQLNNTLIPCDDDWGLRVFGGDDNYPLDEPDVGVDRALTLHLLKNVKEDGCRVTLLGEGADNILAGGSPYHVTKLVRDIPLNRLSSELPHFANATHRHQWRLLASAYLRSIIPTEGINWLGEWLAHEKGGISRKLCNSTEIKPKKFLNPPSLRSQTALTSYFHITKGQYSARLVLFDTITAFVGVTFSFPYFDRRIIDYTLTLPPELLFQNGIRKYILRQSMQGILPESVRIRTRVTHLADLANRGLRDREKNKILNLIQNAYITQEGFVSKNDLFTAWTTFWNENTYPTASMNHALCVEAWMRNYEACKVK